MGLTQPEFAISDHPRGIDSRRQAIERVLTVMRERADNTLPLQAMAEIAGFSPCHFAHVFRHVTGIPPVKFLVALRLERAKLLLLTTEVRVTEICTEVGYKSVGTFTTSFTQLVGLPPGKFRRLPRDLDSDFSRLYGFDPALLSPFVPEAGVTGRISSPDITKGLIFVGLFPTAIPQGRPIVGAFLDAPGTFRLTDVPDGDYHLLAAALPQVKESVECLLPGAALRVARGGRAIIEHGRHRNGYIEIVLRPPQVTDPPVVVALPVLLQEMLALQCQDRVLGECRK